MPEIAGTSPARPKVRRTPPLSWLEPAVITGALVPIAVLFFRNEYNLLSADPIAEILNQLGYLGLTLLVASLACTPLKLVFGWTWPLRIRKTLGLAGFYYILLHFLWYIGKDKSFHMGEIVGDVILHYFILVGFVAFVLLIPLAVTSTNKMIARLGGQRWRKLHKLAYVCGILGVIHFYMRVKIKITEPVVFGSILFLLLGIRYIYSMKKSLDIVRKFRK